MLATCELTTPSSPPGPSREQQAALREARQAPRDTQQGREGRRPRSPAFCPGPPLPHPKAAVCVLKGLQVIHTTISN